MASNVLQNYKKDLEYDFKYNIARYSGKRATVQARPTYTKEDLKEYAAAVTSIIPTIRASGNPAGIEALTSTIKNANIAKAKINTKRLEAFCGNRVKKASTSLSYYTKAINIKHPSVISDALYTVS